MSSQLVKFKEMELIEIDFMGSPMMVVRMKDTGKMYVGVSWICDGLGFDKKDRDSEIRRIKNDLVLIKGATLMLLPTKGGNQQTWAIEIDYLTLWLAKITIDSKRKQRSPETMDKLIEYQLNAKDTLAQAFIGKKKEWDLQREVGKVDRKRMTSSIQTYIPSAKPFTYASYTDMTYKILFNMTAKQIRESRNINKKSELTRDYLTEIELKLIDEAETIVTALTALGFPYQYVKHQLEVKYGNKMLDNSNNNKLLN